MRVKENFQNQKTKTFKRKCFSTRVDQPKQINTEIQ